MRTEGPAFSVVAGLPAKPLEVVECGAAEAAAWDDFAAGANGTYCHLYGWRSVLERSYSLKTLYLTFRSAGEWVGILPLALMPHLPGRPPKAISLPYCNYGGIVAVPHVDGAALRSLAAEYLRARGVRAVEFRERSEDAATSAEVCMLLRLPPAAAQLWAGLNAKVRNQVRKAQRSGLSIRWGREQAGSLYEIYAIRMGELGTPVHSRRFIYEILRNLGDSAQILTVEYRGRPVAAMLLITFQDTWNDPLAASLAEFKAMNPNMLLYWEALKAACEAGTKGFDFGRSHRGSGTYHFKKQWGSEEIGLNYFTCQDGVPTPAAATDFYRNDAASLLSHVWRKLPAALQLWLGPVARRWVP